MLKGERGEGWGRKDGGGVAPIGARAMRSMEGIPWRAHTLI